MALSGFRLYGVEPLGEEDPVPPVPRVSVLTFRELGAVVRRAQYRTVETDDTALEEYRHVVDAVFQRGTVLPAPFGTVFRSGDQVLHWLEMNHIALAEGLHFVEGRCEGRLHVRRKEFSPDDAAADATAITADCFRTLRRDVAAALPLPLGSEVGVDLSAAFLVPRAGWTEFTERVAEQARRSDGLDFELTGPWPPYDFVRIDFGA